MIASAICWPTVRIGFSAPRGFWKIIEIAAPWMRRSCFEEAEVMSSPAKRMRPWLTRPEASSRRVTANAVTDFPEPLSPTTPSVSPAATEKDTPRTASTSPRRVEKVTCRSSMARRGAVSETFTVKTLTPNQSAPSSRTQRSGAPGSIVERGGLRWIPDRRR